MLNRIVFRCLLEPVLQLVRVRHPTHHYQPTMWVIILATGNVGTPDTRADIIIIIIIINKVLIKVTLYNKVIAGALYIVICG